MYINSTGVRYSENRDRHCKAGAAAHRGDGWWKSTLQPLQ